jgi:hypothetical protein
MTRKFPISFQVSVKSSRNFGMEKKKKIILNEEKREEEEGRRGWMGTGR